MSGPPPPLPPRRQSAEVSTIPVRTPVSIPLTPVQDIATRPLPLPPRVSIPLTPVQDAATRPLPLPPRVEQPSQSSNQPEASYVEPHLPCPLNGQQHPGSAETLRHTPCPSAGSQGKLEDAEWYWGNTTWKQVNSIMHGLPDGSYLVRNSAREPGEYALTIKTEGDNHLVRIRHRDGLYYFGGSPQFASVVELVNFYTTHTVKFLNGNLDTVLKYPVSSVEEPKNLVDTNRLPHQDQGTWLSTSLSKQQSDSLLSTKPNGTFLVRRMDLPGWADKEKRIMHTHTLDLMHATGIRRIAILQDANWCYGFYEPFEFKTLVDLICYYACHSLKKHNSKLDTTLKQPAFL